MQNIINQINQTILNLDSDNPHTLAVHDGQVVRVTTIKDYPFSSIQYLVDNADQIIRDINFEAQRFNGLHTNAILSIHHMEYKGVQPPLDSSTTY